MAQKYMLSSKSCSACKDARKILARDFKSGKIAEIDINSKRGNEIINNLKISAIPAIVECNGKKCRLVQYGV